MANRLISPRPHNTGRARWTLELASGTSIWTNFTNGKDHELELPSIGWQLFILDSSQSDPIAFPAFLDTYATPPIDGAS